LDQFGDRLDRGWRAAMAANTYILMHNKIKTIMNIVVVIGC
jgi:hypothetical protein